MKITLCPAATTIAAFLLASSASAQPANDTCANAIPVASQSITAWNPTGATQSVVLPCESFPDLAIDVWYSYTTTGPELVTATVCGGPTEYASLGVYDACSGSLVACDSWSCGSRSQSEVAFQAPGAATYYICLVGYAEVEGPGYLAINTPIVAPPPPNDTCATAEVLAGPGTFPFDSTGAATDGPTASCNVGGRPDTHDVFFRYTAASDEWVRFDTVQQAGGLNTTIQVLDACGGSVLACNDDANWTGEFSGLWVGSLTCPLYMTAGTSYVIRVASSGADSAGGPGTLRLSIVSGPIAYESPTNALLEPGPDCDDDYESDINYGCNPRVDPPELRATPIALCDTYRGHIYQRTTPIGDGTIIHDFDAYHFTLNAADTIHVTGQAQFVGLVTLMSLPCGAGTVYTGQLGQYTNPECGAAEFDLSWDLPAGEYVLGLATAPFDQPVCGQSDEYWFTISGSLPCTPPCPADFDNNGIREVPDIFAFLSAWFAGNPTADFDGNGTIAVPDIFAFLSAWFAGCP